MKRSRITKDDAFIGACVSCIGLFLFLGIAALDASIFPLIGFIVCLSAFHVFSALFYR
jgi:hypothetical protein